MPRFDDCVVILPGQTDALQLTARVRGLFKSHGLVFAQGSDVIFNDAQGRERDPETAESEDEAFAKLLSWPGLGGLPYLFGRQRMPVFFSAGSRGCVDSVSLSVPAAGGEAAQLPLIRELHQSVSSLRTICGYELLSPASWVAEEVERVRRGVFAGSYSVDLR